MKNINEDVVYSMKLDDVKKVSSVTCQVLGQSSINLVENQDYKVISDKSTLFLIITKKMKSQEKHHLTITVLDKDNIIQHWKISCQPKGKKISFSVFLQLRVSCHIRVCTRSKYFAFIEVFIKNSESSFR